MIPSQLSKIWFLPNVQKFENPTTETDKHSRKSTYYWQIIFAYHHKKKKKPMIFEYLTIEQTY